MNDGAKTRHMAKVGVLACLGVQADAQVLIGHGCAERSELER